MTSFTGSNPERQSVGLPGHCDACADQGHLAAHPHLGCSDVGCDSAHPEPVEDTDVAQPVAPMVAIVHSYDGTHTVSEDRPTGHTSLPVQVWHTLRRATNRGGVSTSMREMQARDVAPTGWLYTATGAFSLDGVLSAMWTCPEAVAMRGVPHTYEQNRDPHLATLESAQDAMNGLWVDFLASIERVTR